MFVRRYSAPLVANSLPQTLVDIHPDWGKTEVWTTIKNAGERYTASFYRWFSSLVRALRPYDRVIVFSPDACVTAFGGAPEIC